jgi:peroxiredoxin
MTNKIRRYTSCVALPLLLAAAFACASSSGDAKTTADTPAATPVSVPVDAVADRKAKVAANEKAIRDMLELGKVGKITYLDERGLKMSEYAFFEHVTDGQSFAAEKVKDVGGATVETLKLHTKEQQAQSDKPATYKIKPGEKFPGFRLEQLAGGKIDSKQLAGHFALVNFYFAQCAPCRKEIPDLNALAMAHKDMKFVALTFDSKDDARQFVSDTQFAWPIAPDANSFIQEIGVKAYPAFALLDPKGIVVAMATHSEIARQDGDVGKWLARWMPAPKS